MRALDNSLHPFGHESVWKKRFGLIKWPAGGYIENVWAYVEDVVDAAVDSIHENVYDDLYDDLREDEDHK